METSAAKEGQRRQGRRPPGEFRLARLDHEYLAGQQTRDNLQNFRRFGGAQSYPSRTKSVDNVDLANWDSFDD